MTAADASSSWRRVRGRRQLAAERASLDEREDAGTRRRWPWALLAAVLGAAGGAAVASLVRQRVGADAPGAQEPHQLRAVVDRPAPPEPPR